MVSELIQVVFIGKNKKNNPCVCVFMGDFEGKGRNSKASKNTDSRK